MRKQKPAADSGVSRRGFLKTAGVGLLAPPMVGPPFSVLLLNPAKRRCGWLRLAG